MIFKKIAILTSRESWFVPYARRLVRILKDKNLHARLFYNHKKIAGSFEVVFILSHFKKIDRKHLLLHKHNLVVHESGLPKGKGWAPLFWQILEGKNKIPVVLLEASKKMDGGDVYIKEYIRLKGSELCDEIRDVQGRRTIDISLEFLEQYKYLRPKRQKGSATSYRKRTPGDSELDMDKTLRKQFNLLRIADNKRFPAFFIHKGSKYILKIYRAKKGLSA